MPKERQSQGKSRSAKTRSSQPSVHRRRPARRGPAPDAAELQQRMGNRGTQAWLAESASPNEQTMTAQGSASAAVTKPASPAVEKPIESLDLARAEPSLVGRASAPKGAADGPAYGTEAPAAPEAEGPRPSAAPTEAVPQAGGQAATIFSGGEDPEAILTTLASTKATDAPAALTQATTASVAALTAQRDAAQARLPEVQTPTGMPAKKRSEPNAEARAPGVAPNASGADRVLSVAHAGGGEEDWGALVAEARPAPAPTPTQLAEGGTGEATIEDPVLAKSAQGAMRRVSSPVTAVPTKAADAPQVDLSGEADPEQIEAARQASDADMARAGTEAMQQAGQDFGEADIAPRPDDEILAASSELRAVSLTAPEAPGAVPLPPQARMAIDADATPLLQQKLQAEQSKYSEGKATYDQKTELVHAKAAEDMERLERDTETAQQEAATSAREEVTGARTEWRGEIEGVESEFRTKAGAAQQEHRTKIDSARKAGDEKAKQHLADAEKKAAEKKQKAEADVARKKQEAEEESGGFWGWVKSKAKALIDGLKAAVNFVYDNLRKLVKGIFELAKALAMAAIELARMAIVAYIRAYGAILKGLVSVALAAFPEKRDKFIKDIDEAVAKAESAVNAAAAALKKGVAAIIDFVAGVIDGLLGFIQDLYNAAFTIMGMIVSGEFAELLRRIGYLIDAAKAMPAQFETAAYEELLGGNLDEPLSPEELMQAGHVPSGAAGASAAGAGVTQSHKGSWTDANVGVEQIAAGEVLTSELSRELMLLTGGEGEVGFGESQEADRNLESILGTGAPTAESATAAGPQRQRNPDDGLTPRQRAAIKWEMMKQGLATWFEANWPYVLAAGILGIAGFIIANILTGGAVLGAVLALMPVLTYVFAGILIAQIAGHVRDYVTKGWEGNDSKGAGKSLAKALAAGAIELISILTFKVGGAALKGAKAAAKGVAKGASAIGRGAKAAAKGAARAARRAGSFVIRGGKVLLRGLGRGFSRAAKRLRNLGKTLLKRLKFKKFRITIKGRKFKLEGYINPWVLLASGTLVEVDQKDLTRIDGDGTARLGHKVKIKGEVEEGFVVGVKKKGGASRSVERLEKKPARRKRKYEEISDPSLDLPARRAKISGSKGFDYDAVAKQHGTKVANTMRDRGKLRSAIGARAGDEAHHIIPVEMIDESVALRKAIDEGFEFNTKVNGRALSKFSSRSAATAAGRHAHHPNYSQKVRKLLSKFDDLVASGKMSGKEAKDRITELAKQVGKVIDDNPATKIDNLKLH